MFEISILKNKFVINQDGKKTSIPLSNLVYLDFHKNQYGEFYEIYGFFLSEERLDGFDSYLKKYNGKIVHIFSGILDKYPFENKKLFEFNPFTFANAQNPIFISLNQEDKPDDIVKYINLDYVVGFNIFLDTRKLKEDKLFEVTLDGNLDVVKKQTQSLKPITYVGLSVINDDEFICTSTQSFINSLENIKLQLSSQQSKVTHWIDETLDLLERQLVFAN